MASKYVAHVVAKEVDESKATASFVFHQETVVDGTSETTDTAMWTYKNFVNACVWNSTLNLTEATFKLHIEEQDVVLDVVLFDDSLLQEDGEDVPTEPFKVV